MKPQTARWNTFAFASPCEESGEPGQLDTVRCVGVSIPSTSEVATLTTAHSEYHLRVELFPPDVESATSTCGEKAAFRDLKAHTVSRRFSDFQTVLKQLHAAFPAMELPELPEKRWFGSRRRSVVECRRRCLETFLSSICIVPCVFTLPALRDFLGFDDFTSALVTLMVQPDRLAISRLVENSLPYPMLHSVHVDLPSVLMYPRLLMRALDDVKQVFAVSSDVDAFLDKPLTLATVNVRMYHDAGAEGLPVNVNAVCLLLDVLIHTQVSRDTRTRIFHLLYLLVHTDTRLVARLGLDVPGFDQLKALLDVDDPVERAHTDMFVAVLLWEGVGPQNGLMEALMSFGEFLLHRLFFSTNATCRAVVGLIFAEMSMKCGTEMKCGRLVEQVSSHIFSLSVFSVKRSVILDDSGLLVGVFDPTVFRVGLCRSASFVARLAPLLKSFLFARVLMLNILADVDSAFIDPPLLELSPWNDLLRQTWLGQLPLSVMGPQLPEERASDELCAAGSEEGVCQVFPQACVGIQWLDMHVDDDTGLGWFRNCLRPLIPTFEGPVCAFIRSALRVPEEDPLVSAILRTTLSFNPGSYSQRLFVVVRQSLSMDVPSAADNSLADLRILLSSLKQSINASELQEISVATEDVLSKCSTFRQNHHCDLLQNAVEGVLQIRTDVASLLEYARQLQSQAETICLSFQQTQASLLDRLASLSKAEESICTMKGAVQSLFSPWLQACAEVDREYTDCQTLWKSLKAVEATLHQQTTKVIALQKEMSLKSSTLKRLNKKSESRDVTEADLKRALASKQAELSKLQVLADAMEGDSVLDTTLTKLRFETENAGRALDSHTQDMLEIDSRRLTLNETIDNLKLQLDTLRGSEQEARHERNGQREKAKSQQRLLEDAESSLRKCTKELKIQLDSFIDRSLVFATEHSALVADVHRHYLGQIHILSAQDRVRSPIEVLRYGLEEEKQGRQSVLTVLTGVLSDLYGVEKEIEDSLQPSSTVEDENQEQHIF